MCLIASRLSPPLSERVLLSYSLEGCLLSLLAHGLLERSCIRKRARCKVFYCDPMKSWQKPQCERNHSELRKIIPKGASFKRLTPRKLAVVCSHVNSYGRHVLGGACPYQVARITVPAELLDALGVVHVPPQDVVMSPSLIEL